MRAFFRPGPSRRVGSRSSSTISFKLTDGYKRCVDVTDRKTPVTSNFKKREKSSSNFFCHRNIDRRRSAGKFRRQVKKARVDFFSASNIRSEIPRKGATSRVALLAPSLGCMREMMGGGADEVAIPWKKLVCLEQKVPNRKSIFKIPYICDGETT